MTAPAGLIHFTGESSILPRCRLSRVWWNGKHLCSFRKSLSMVFRSRRPDLSRPPLNHIAWPPMIVSCKPVSHSLKNTVLRRFISEEPCPKFIFLEKLPLFTFYIIHLLLVSHYLHLCPCENFALGIVVPPHLIIWSRMPMPQPQVIMTLLDTQLCRIQYRIE